MVFEDKQMTMRKNARVVAKMEEALIPITVSYVLCIVSVEYLCIHYT
jgi:hypothetical protein